MLAKAGRKPKVLREDDEDEDDEDDEGDEGDDGENEDEDKEDKNDDYLGDVKNDRVKKEVEESTDEDKGEDDGGVFASKGFAFRHVFLIS